jgi:hypothetical protein
MRRAFVKPLFVLLSLAATVVPASAQTPAPTTPATGPTCTQADLAAVVDDMGAKLRTSSTAEYPRLQARLRQLAAVKGWPEVEAEAKAQDLLEDRESLALDEKAGQLLIELDRKGPSETTSPTCAQVTELKSIANQLLEVTRAKSAHSIARLDIELGVRPTATAKAPEVKPEAKPELKLETKPAEAAPKRPAVASATPVPPPLPSRPQVPQVPLPWDTHTVRSPTASPPVVSPPDTPSAGSTQPWSPPVASADLEFTQEDIRAAGRGVFGTISAELASVIEHAFKSYGHPTGYILGTEGGAALLAGLRYGDGVLVTKRDGERRIYWQGPSVGYDFGIAGSRTLVLVYKLGDPEAMLARFGGIDGSAYLVGGVGLTVLKKGPIILAPIRTGLGLRFGANVGYLKFTSKPSFNPF